MNQNRVFLFVSLFVCFISLNIILFRAGVDLQLSHSTKIIEIGGENYRLIERSEPANEYTFRLFINTIFTDSKICRDSGNSFIKSVNKSEEICVAECKSLNSLNSKVEPFNITIMIGRTTQSSSSPEQPIESTASIESLESLEPNSFTFFLKIKNRILIVDAILIGVVILVSLLSFCFQKSRKVFTIFACLLYLMNVVILILSFVTHNDPPFGVWQNIFTGFFILIFYSFYAINVIKNNLFLMKIRENSIRLGRIISDIDSK